MKIVFAIIAILGYIANINKKLVPSYILWAISNTCWTIYSFKTEEYEMMFMFLAYNIFLSIGIIKNYKNK